MHFKAAEHRVEPATGHRSHRATKGLHLGGHRRQYPAHDLGEILWVGPAAQATRVSQVREQDAYHFSFLCQAVWPMTRRGRRRTARTSRGDEGRGGVDPIERRSGAYPETFESGATPIISSYDHVAQAFGRVSSKQGCGRLLTARVVFKAPLPGLHHRLKSRVSCAFCAVSCQRKASLLA